MDLQQEVQKIFRDIFDDDNLKIQRETTMTDIEDWDSLAQMELVVAMEKHFKIRFRVNEIAEMRNVGEMMDAIASRMKG